MSQFSPQQILPGKGDGHFGMQSGHQLQISTEECLLFFLSLERELRIGSVEIRLRIWPGPGIAAKQNIGPKRVLLHHPDHFVVKNHVVGIGYAMFALAVEKSDDDRRINIGNASRAVRNNLDGG